MFFFLIFLVGEGYIYIFILYYFFNLIFKCLYWYIYSYLECIYNILLYSWIWWLKGFYICYFLFCGFDRCSEDDLSIFVLIWFLWLCCRRYSCFDFGDNMLGCCFFGICSLSCNWGIFFWRKFVEFWFFCCLSNWFVGFCYCRCLLCYIGRDIL